MRRVALVTEEGAIACAKVQAVPMYEVKLRPAISLAGSRHFMHSTRLASRPRQSHLPRSGYGRAMGRPRHGGGGPSMPGGQGAAGAPCRGDPAHQEASEQNAGRRPMALFWVGRRSAARRVGDGWCSPPPSSRCSMRCRDTVLQHTSVARFHVTLAIPFRTAACSENWDCRCTRTGSSRQALGLTRGAMRGWAAKR